MLKTIVNYIINRRIRYISDKIKDTEEMTYKLKELHNQLKVDSILSAVNSNQLSTNHIYNKE